MTSGEVAARLDATLQREGVAEVRTDLDAERRTAFAAGARQVVARVFLAAVLYAGTVALGHALSWTDPWSGFAATVLIVALGLGVAITFDTLLDAPHMPLVVTVTHDGVSVCTDRRRAGATYPWSAITSVGLDRSTGAERVVLGVDPDWLREELGTAQAPALWQQVKAEADPRPFVEARLFPRPDRRKPEGVVRLPRHLDVAPDDLAAWLDVRRRQATSDG